MNPQFTIIEFPGQFPSTAQAVVFEALVPVDNSPVPSSRNGDRWLIWVGLASLAGLFLYLQLKNQKSFEHLWTLPNKQEDE